MEETGYTVGRMRPEWGKGGAQSLTFVVTEDCNLRCNSVVIYSVYNNSCRGV